MNNSNLKFFLIYKNENVKKKFLKESKKLNLEKNITNKIEEANVIICIGGDGCMLSAMSDFAKYEIPFYGINFGRKGFLMNSKKVLSSKKGIFEEIQFGKKFAINQLKFETKRKKYYAVNEVYAVRDKAKPNLFQIKLNQEKFSFLGDGIMISNSIGSTSYNLSLGGPIVESKLDCMIFTIVNGSNQKGSKSLILKHDSQIEIFSKNKFKIEYDGKTLMNQEQVKIKLVKENNINLIFSEKTLFQKELAELITTEN